MGLGKSMKETTLHHFRDPLISVVDGDGDVNLMGIIIVGCPDDNGSKYFVSHRAAQMAAGFNADGAILSCNGIGNNHVDYANTIDEIESSGIPTAALSLCPASDFVVQVGHPEAVINYYANYEATGGAISTVLAEHTVTAVDARKALALLKLRMRKKKI